jgi:hypothetical protein
MTEIPPDIDGWAHDHGFRRTDEEIGGATPLLRLGFLDTTDDSYRGHVGDRQALLAEFTVGSPDVTEEFGGAGTTSTLFTLFLVGVDAHDWPRLTVHPARFSDHDWMRRLLHMDHVVHTISPEMDARYRVISSNAVPADRVRGLFTADLIAWWLAQKPELIADVENHPSHGGYLTVAHTGFAEDDRDLDHLFAQASHLADVFDPG